MACVVCCVPSTKKYHDREWLYEQYHEQNRTMRDIAQECGVTGTTISDWLDRHDIDTRDQKEAQRSQQSGKHTDREWLAQQYWGKERALSDIADECGVDRVTIMNWMERFGIPRRGTGDHARREKVTFSVGPRGYRFVQTRDPDNTKRKVYIHQLVAISKGADPDKVFSNGDYQVHHKNGVKWDNRPENIELLTQEEHDELHATDRDREATGEFV